LFSPPCRSFAQALPGLWITRFLARPFLRSAQLGFSVQPRGTGAESRYAKGKSPAFRLEAGLKVERPSLSTIPAGRHGGGGEGRSLLRCRHFKCHIECDACLLDPRLIDPFLSAVPRPALERLGVKCAMRWP